MVNSWTEAAGLVKNYPGAVYKSFSLDEGWLAKEFVRIGKWHELQGEHLDAKMITELMEAASPKKMSSSPYPGAEPPRWDEGASDHSSVYGPRNEDDEIHWVVYEGPVRGVYHHAEGVKLTAGVRNVFYDVFPNRHEAKLAWTKSRGELHELAEDKTPAGEVGF